MEVIKNGIFIHIILPMIISTFFLANTQVSGINTETEFSDIHNYTITTGVYEKSMRNFQLVMVNPEKITITEVQKLKNDGVLVFAVIGIGYCRELEKGNGQGRDGNASYYIYDQRNQPLKNPIDGTYIIDARDNLWQEKMMKYINELSMNGYKGFVLDPGEKFDEYRYTLEGIVSLIKRINTEFPSIKLVLKKNITILSYSAQYLSGFIFEDFGSRYDRAAKEYLTFNNVQQIDSQIKVDIELKPLIQKYGLKIFTLDYASPKSGENISLLYAGSIHHGFVPYVTTVEMDHVFSYKIKSGKPTESVESILNIIDFYRGIQKASSENQSFKNRVLSVKADSCFMKYNNPAGLIDGFINLPSLYWKKLSWYSKNSAADHWVEFDFIEPLEVESIKIYWHDTPNACFVQAFQSGEWRNIAQNNSILSWEDTTTFYLNNFKGKTFRIVQPKGKGSEDMIQIMSVDKINFMIKS